MPLEPILGQIMPAGFTRLSTQYWLPCDGRLLQISQNSALFALLGTRFGGDGRTTFGIPDLRGRAMRGGTADDRTIAVGLKSGTATVTLSIDQMPHHRHAISASTSPGTGGRPVLPGGKVFGTTTTAERIFGLAGSSEVPLATGSNVTAAGSSQPHDNMQPYLAIAYYIAIAGIYPQRS